MTKNAHKTVHVSYGANQHRFPSMYYHQVFRLTLPAGLRFAFDPTGAQSGWQEYLAPWDEYEKHRVHCIVEISRIDAWSTKRLMEEFDEAILSAVDTQGARELDIQIIFNLVACIVDTTLDVDFTNVGMTELLYKLPDDGFMAFKDYIIDFSRECLESMCEENGDLRYPPLR